MALDHDQQIALRNQIAQICFDYIDADVMNSIGCYIACFGAAAICAGILPLAQREKLVGETEGLLLDHANKRADEMRSGAFDQQMTGH